MSESNARWERSPGFVYFIAAGDPPQAIKIGISTRKDIVKRLSAHQGSNHVQLFLLGVIPFFDGERPMLDAERRERELHAQFAALQRFKAWWAGSEWFNPGQTLIDFIREAARPVTEFELPATIARFPEPIDAG